MYRNLPFLLFLIFFACDSNPELQTDKLSTTTRNSKPNHKYQQLFDKHPEYVSDGFDYPVGKPDAKGYYNAQGFGGKSHHLGDDWNATTGGNSDLGHPIYAIANGYLNSVKDHKGGWCQVIRMVHKVDTKYVESLYAHCDKMLVKEGDWVKKGQKIATIGNCEGRYYAHLHLEIRHSPDLPLGGGYSKDTSGYIDPTIFIKKHRN